MQVMIASGRCLRVAQRCRSGTFFCSRAKKDSIAALSPQEPGQPAGLGRPGVRAVLACRVTEPDQWCRRCAGAGSARNTVTRRLAHEPLGWRSTVLLVTVRRYRVRARTHDAARRGLNGSVFEAMFIDSMAMPEMAS